MKYKFIVTSLVIWALFSGCKSANSAVNEYDNNKVIKSDYNVDICIYGGTSAGVTAAYAAKKLGKTVLLVEPGKHLGGMTTSGLGLTDFGHKSAIIGLSYLFYCRVGECYGKAEQWTFPPSVASKVMNRFITDAQVNVLYNHRIIKAKVKDKKIVSISLEESQPSGGKSVTVHAKQFIDCSYEGDLMAKSGVSYFLGREDNSKYGETYDGVQLAIHHQFPDGIDPYKVKGDPKSGYCWGITFSHLFPNSTGDNLTHGRLLPNGTGDKLIQSYNFRLCLTNNVNNMRPFEKPDNYDASHYELFLRILPSINYNIYKCLSIDALPDQKFDINNNGAFSTDMIGMNYDYPDGSYATRDLIYKAHVDYTKGFLYFMSHDERVPLAFRKQALSFGYAKDEFTDNDNFPPQLYIREARRMDGEYIMTEKNCMGKEKVNDGIIQASYTMDSHNCQRIVVNGMVKNEGDAQYRIPGPYPVSYRSITPKRTQCTNLLVPVCLSASHIAYGSIRMEPVFMGLGEAAAIASSLAIDNNSMVQQVDAAKIQQILKDNPYLDK